MHCAAECRNKLYRAGGPKAAFGLQHVVCFPVADHRLLETRAENLVGVTPVVLVAGLKGIWRAWGGTVPRHAGLKLGVCDVPAKLEEVCVCTVRVRMSTRFNMQHASPVQGLTCKTQGMACAVRQQTSSSM